MKNNVKRNILFTLLGTDGYKLGHRKQYPQGTEIIFSNFTPRGSKHPEIKEEIEVFGLDYVIDNLKNSWDDFFNLESNDATEIIEEYKSIAEVYLGQEYEVDHLYELYEHKKLPIEIYALPNYTVSKLNQPIFVIWNTDNKFYWLVNYLETWLINHSWLIVTSATIANEYRKIFDRYALETSTQLHEDVLVNYQGHDFSCRGMSSQESSILAGLGHLAHFKGTDTLNAMLEWNRFYKNENDLEVMSVNATEHSVMCAGGKENEEQTYERLIEQYPKGILSIVSDTWNLWNVLTVILKNLKEKILSRDGKIVIRPDSGNPVDIVCGTKKDNPETPEEKGALRLLDEVFGSTINDKGFKVLESHIGLIYGDQISLSTTEEILSKLKEMGYSSENVVFGIGASTYQRPTRDTFKFATKATAIKINGEWKEIFKDPITDSGKKSAKGILNIVDGELVQGTTIEEIRNKSDFVKLI